MVKILETFLGLHLISGLSGDDGRYAKIQKAAENLAESYREDASQLIPAILTGLNPQVNTLAPAILQVVECLQKQWGTFKTVYPDEPVNLYRGIILEACSLVAKEGNNASIMWLTASDVFPLFDLEKEKETLQKFMFSLAKSAESNNIREIQDVAFQKTKQITLGEILEAKALSISKTNKNQLLDGIGRAVGGSYVDPDGQNIAKEPRNRYYVG